LRAEGGGCPWFHRHRATPLSPERGIWPQFGYFGAVMARGTLESMRRTTKGRIAIAAGGAAALVAAAGGCGSNTETSSIETSASKPSNGAISQAAFVKQANAICAEANSAINAFPAIDPSSGTATSEGALQTVTGALQS